MKHSRFVNLLRCAAVPALILIGSPSVWASTFVWVPSGNAAGSWTSAANWTGGTLPTTTSDIANFNSVDITADSAVTLDGNQSINTLIFGDPAPVSAANWILNPGPLNAYGSTLTLGGTFPAITVNTLGTGKSAIINATLAGSTVWTKNGPGTLTLGGYNTFSAGFTNAAGQVNFNTSIPGGGTITFAGGSMDNTAYAINVAGNAMNWNSNFTFAGTSPENLTGAATMNASRTLTVNGPMFYLSGVISGTGFSLTKAGAGMMFLTGNNTYSGGTIINSGTLCFKSESVTGGAPLGNVPATTTAGNIVINGGTLSLLGGSTTITNTRGMAVGPSSGSGGGTIDVLAGSTLSYGGIIANNGGGTGSLIKSGYGTLVLSNANTFSGGTTVTNGTLMLDFNSAASPVANILSGTAGGLTLGGGTFKLNGKAATANSQTVQGLTVSGGGNTINLAPSASGTANLALNAISRTGGTVNFIGAGTNTTTTANNTAGIFGGWATFNSADWAANDTSGNIVACTNYIVMAASGGTTNDNDLMDGTVAALSGPLVANSVKIGGAGSLDLAGNSLTVNGTAGGWLTPAAQNVTISDSVGGAYLGAGSLNEFIAQGSGTLTVNVPVVGNGTAGGLTKSGAGTLYLASSNNYTGNTTVNGGTLNLASGGSLATGSTVKVNTGGTLTVSSGGTINGNVEVGPSTGSTTANLNQNGTIAGTLTIDGAEAPVSPNPNALNQCAPGYAKLFNGSSTTNVINNGILAIDAGATLNNLGIISSPNGLGGIIYNSTSSNLLTLASGSSFGYFQPGLNSLSTLQVQNNGTVGFDWFGYSEPAPQSFNSYNTTLNGGTWNFGYIGQNNSGAHFIGTANITGGAAVSILYNNGYDHGAWNVTYGSLTFFGAVSEGHQASSVGLSLAVNNSGGGAGFLRTVGGGLTLGLAPANGAAENNSLTVAAGGTANIAGGLTVGTTTSQANPENNTVTLSGGKLVVNGTIAASTGSGQTDGFNWTGGQLTALGITPSNGFNGAGSSINSTTLANSGGMLAPGDFGTPGKTTINGNYTVSSPSAVLAIDIGGTNQATVFQNGATNYDFVAVTGTATLGGQVSANLINNFTPAATNAFKILSAVGGLIGSASSLGYDGYVPVTTNGVPVSGKYFQVVLISTNVVLTNYGTSTLPALVASFSPMNATGTAPLPVLFTDTSSGAITNRQWDFGDGSTLSTLSTNISHTFTNLGTYTVVLTVSGLNGSTMSVTGRVSVVTPGGTLVWTGAHSSAWDLATTNWVDQLATPYVYADADSVIFDDSASVTNVVLNRAAAPNSVDFNNSSKNYTISGSGSISGSTYLNVNNGGSVTLLTALNYLGETTVNGTLQLGDGVVTGCSLDNSSAITDNGSLIFNQPDNHTISVPISGGGALTKSGTGTLTLGVDNNGTFSGSVTINGGVLSAADYTGFGTTSTLNLSGGGMAQFTAGPTYYNYTLNLGAGGGGLANAVAISSVGTSITGTGPFTKAGNGLMVFDQPPVYTGNTIVAAGTLQLDTGGSSVSLPGNVALNGGSLTYERSDTVVQPGVISGNSANGFVNNASTAAGNTNTLTFADGINLFNTVKNSSAGSLVLTGSANSTNNLGGTAAVLTSISAGSSLVISNGIWNEPYGNGNNGNIAISGGTLNIGLMRAGYGNFTVNGGSLLFETAANDGGNNSQFQFGNGMAANGTSAITVSSGVLDVYAGNYGNDLEATTSGTTGTTTADIVQSGGVVRIGVSAGPAPNARGLIIGGAGAIVNTLAYYSLGGGKLLVYGAISSQSTNGSTCQTGFNWTDGQLSAGTIITTNFNEPGNSILNNTLTQTAGTLAPGDLGTAGKTTINGSYSLGVGGILAMDIGGTAPANAFQNTNNYDTLAVSGGGWFWRAT